jgi:hypothetical protein
MDRETMDRICAELEDEVRQRFPGRPGSRRHRAAVRRRPGDRAGRAAGPGVPRGRGRPGGLRLLDAFMYDNKAALAQFRRFIARRIPEASQLQFTFDQSADPRATRTVMHLRRALAEQRAAELTPVMARLGPVDLETLDALITAGIVASPAEGLRWALARIRERPAYGQLRERAREIERLKTEF